MATRNPTMSEELGQLLKNLKLRRMLEIYEEQLRAAEKQDVSYSEFLTRLLRAQCHHRLETAYRCQFIRAQDLFDEMYASLADRSSRRLVKRLARLDILYIDRCYA